ncbi:hypothetical protein OESDEN_17957 [Oesophagostomum dentatum]|uniref:Uncharacterized protein n=1 Tax=Oesophagostomum dentatum TaxID=61180 RepID=A0A0B1SBP4_OESDE|nr:hypothetical protein OESDEN_17957 [Oesophagostomum dentatum]
MCYAIIQVRWENQYMWALQLIDQENQDLLDHQEIVEEHDERDHKLGADNASSIRWRSSHYESSASEDTHLEDGDRRRSTVILDSKDMPVVPPPVLGVYLSRSISIRQQGSLTRSESALSKRKRSYLKLFTKLCTSPLHSERHCCRLTILF